MVRIEDRRVVLYVPPPSADPFFSLLLLSSGPSEYSQELMDYLGTKNLKATYYIVRLGPRRSSPFVRSVEAFPPDFSPPLLQIGSRAIERPNVIREQHMLGHELAAQ